MAGHRVFREDLRGRQIRGWQVIEKGPEKVRRLIHLTSTTESQFAHLRSATGQPPVSFFPPRSDCTVPPTAPSAVNCFPITPSLSSGPPIFCAAPPTAPCSVLMSTPAADSTASDVPVNCFPMAPRSSKAFGRVAPLKGELAVFLAFCASPADWEGNISHDVINVDCLLGYRVHPTILQRLQTMSYPCVVEDSKGI